VKRTVFSARGDNNLGINQINEQTPNPVCPKSRRKIVVSPTEDRHLVELLPGSESVSGRHLSLAFSHHPVLDANMVPGPRIEPARDISGCVDLRNAGLEVLVHQDALVRLDANSLGKIVYPFRLKPWLFSLLVQVSSEPDPTSPGPP